MSSDNIKLPPLPEWSKMDNLNGLVPSEIRQHLTEYATAAIEQYAKRIAELEAALQSQNDISKLVKRLREADKPLMQQNTFSEVRALLREAADALRSQDRGDAERLDWLEEQAQTSRTGVTIDYVYDAEDGYVNEKGYRFMRHRFIGPLGRSAREAVDHARRIEGLGDA